MRSGLCGAGGSINRQRCRGLLPAVFRHMKLPSLFGVMSGVKGMAAGYLSLMGRFFVLPALMMFGCFAVMAGSMGMMFCGLLMVSGCFLRHGIRSFIFGGPLGQTGWVPGVHGTPRRYFSSHRRVQHPARDQCRADLMSALGHKRK
jgi:hypothetical protein